MKADDLKRVVQQKYAAIASQSVLLHSSSCCESVGCCGELEFSMIGDEYAHLEGHVAEADLNLGCGIPTQYAGIKPGDHVLDLGSGAGNDCFVARAIIGETGRVTGLDFTQAMVERARENNQKLGFTNVEFVQGDIEAMPFVDNSFEVIVSNCVLNLVPDKDKAFAQMMRVLKSGGHFCVSDVVIKGTLPESLQKDAEMYVGCVAGAVSMDQYMEIIGSKGFINITTHKLKPITIPENVLEKHLSETQMKAFGDDQTGIFSMTISGYKD